MYAIKTVTELRPVEQSDLYANVQELLIAWARWRWAGHGANVGYPSQTAFRRHMRMPGTATVAPVAMSDDLAQQVDLAVGQLKLRSEPVLGDHRWQVLTDSYLNGWTDALIARKRRIGRNVVRTSRLAAENWIEGRMY